MGCDNDAKWVAAAAAQCGRTNNYRDGRTACDRRVVGLGRLGRPVAVAEVAGSELACSFQVGVAEQRVQVPEE